MAYRENRNTGSSKNVVFMFPGQGSQYSAMGMDFLEANSKYKKYFDISSEIIGTDIIKVINGEDGKNLLNDTRYSQISIYCLSCALNDYLIQELSFKKNFIISVMGHSLGEYSALYSSGAYSFKQGAELVIYRGKLMSEADSSAKGMMAAVLGAEVSEINDVLKEFKDKVYIANYNDYFQTVISGYSEAVKDAITSLRKRGIQKIIPLKVGVASHCPLMEKVSHKLGTFISKNVEFTDLSLPFFSTTEVAYRNKHDIRGVLTGQLVNPINWVGSIEYLFDMGVVDIFIEVGPGKVLSGLVKRIANSKNMKVMILNTDKIGDIKYLECSLREEGIIDEVKE